MLKEDFGNFRDFGEPTKILGKIILSEVSFSRIFLGCENCVLKVVRVIARASARENPKKENFRSTFCGVFSDLKVERLSFVPFTAYFRKTFIPVIGETVTVLDFREISPI